MELLSMIASLSDAKMQYEIFNKTITPDFAEKALDFNGGNRALTTNNVEKLVNDMKNGRFVHNGSSNRDACIKAE